MINTAKTYWRVRHTKLGCDGPQYSFFLTKDEAEKFSYDHAASGGGADNPHHMIYYPDSQWEEIDIIEEHIRMRVKIKGKESF